MSVEVTCELKNVIQFALTSTNHVWMSYLQIDIFLENIENTDESGKIYKIYEW